MPVNLRPRLLAAGGTAAGLLLVAPLVGFAVQSLSAHPTSRQTPNAGTSSKPAETLTRDTPRTTAAGTTFTAPSDWSISSGDAIVALQPPGADSRMGIVETTAAEADAAIAAAWTVFAPETGRPLLLVTPGPGRNGWQEQRTYASDGSSR